jgi:hypothetical protein
MIGTIEVIEQSRGKHYGCTKNRARPADLSDQPAGEWIELPARIGTSPIFRLQPSESFGFTPRFYEIDPKIPPFPEAQDHRNTTFPAQEKAVEEAPVRTPSGSRVHGGKTNPFHAEAQSSQRKGDIFIEVLEQSRTKTRYAARFGRPRLQSGLRLQYRYAFRKLRAPPGNTA